MVVTQGEGDRKMQLAVLDHPQQFRRARFKKLDPHTRISLFVLIHEGREEGGKRVRRCSDPQDAGAAAAKRAAGGEHRLGLGQQGAAMTKKLIPFARQRQPAAQIVEQPETQLFLQSLDPA